MNGELCKHCGLQSNEHHLTEDQILAAHGEEGLKALKKCPGFEVEKEEKPLHCKPNLYAFYFERMKEIAKKFGYNLVVHGSMNRDLDLIAVPWIDEPEEEFEMIQALDRCINGSHFTTKEEYMFSILHKHRNNYIININRGGAFNDYRDEKYYLDISVTPTR